MAYRVSEKDFEKLTGAKVKAKKGTGRKRNRTLENAFDTLWRQCGGLDVPWVKDYKFNLPNSGMELDRALPHLKIGIEIDGGQGQKSGHSNWEGLERDAKKINQCTFTQWQLFKLTTSMMTHEHVQPIVEYINSKVREYENNVRKDDVPASS